MRVYRILDESAKKYFPIFAAENDAVASRMVADSLEEDTPASRRPFLFSLWNVAVYSDDRPHVNPVEPRCLGNLAECARNVSTVPLEYTLGDTDAHTGGGNTPVGADGSPLHYNSAYDQTAYNEGPDDSEGPEHESGGDFPTLARESK